MQYEYKTRGVCASKILFDLDGDTVSNIRFIGGCSGNTQGVSLLANGMKVDDVIARLKGVRCGMNPPPAPISSRRRWKRPRSSRKHSKGRRFVHEAPVQAAVFLMV